MDSFLKEETIARTCEKATYEERLAANGMASLSDARLGPRKKCEVLKQAGEAKACLVTEAGQRAMLESVRDSLPSYISGVRCWAAFNDALGRSQHFPVTESMAIEWAAVFSSSATYEQYLKHLRFVHKLLRFSNDWYSPSVV